MSKKNKKQKAAQNIGGAREKKVPILELKNRQNDSNKINYNVSLTPYDALFLEDLDERRLCLFGEICSDDDYDGETGDTSVMEIVMHIMRYNREDKGVKSKDRKPIILYINSPGGDVIEGFALVSAIETSCTPVYTVNIGQWSSMAFLVGITGKKRFAFPHSMFLLHDGTTFAVGSSEKVQDKADFDKRYEAEIIKRHVLKYTKMSKKEYQNNRRKEYYMLTSDALEKGVIDKIVKNIDEIL